MNKQTLQEKPHGTPYFPFESFSQADLTGSYFAPYHWHDELEFLYITKGSLTLRTENSSYALTEGHVYFINPGIVHEFSDTAKYPITMHSCFPCLY